MKIKDILQNEIKGVRCFQETAINCQIQAMNLFLIGVSICLLSGNAETLGLCNSMFPDLSHQQGPWTAFLRKQLVNQMFWNF